MKNGAEVIGIPCNTAHAPAIFDKIKQTLLTSCEIVHLIDEVGYYLNTHHPDVKNVGILGTTGTLMAKFPMTLEKYGIKVIEPSKEIQELFVHPSIYSKQYGIKSFSNPVNKKAKNNVITAATYLSRKGAEAIVLGCTELPLAINQKKVEQSLIIDATEILAKALIRQSIINT